MDIHTVDPDDLPAWRHAVSETFAFDAAGDVEGDARLRALLAPERTFAAWDRGRIVGTAAAFDLGLALPGGHAPMSGLTMVTVRPTHRRRGILRALIAAHLEAARAKGDPLSGLWASEATIYGRFGYGVAAESDVLTLDDARDTVAVGHPRDDVELVDDGSALAEAPRVYDQALAARPGMYTRSPAWWRYRRMVDRPDQRQGATARGYALARRGDVTTGYVAFRQRLTKSDQVFTGAFMIDELVALDARAEATLWSFCADADLYPKVSWWNAPIDSALPWLVADRRRVTRRRVETLWLHVGDVAATLGARGYGADGALTLALEDTRWRLTVEHGRGACAPIDGPADLTLERAALGSVLLGAVAPSLLARVGRVTGGATALALADRMFASPIAAWCPEVF